jgi:antitoxin YefM
MPRTLSKKRSRRVIGRGPMAMVEARKRLTTLPEVFEKHPDIGAVQVTRRGKPVLAVMSWDLYESITETLEIMSDPEMMAAFRQGVKDMNEGKVYPWEQVKRELGL